MRKYYLVCARQLHYMQPSCVRDLQRTMLIDLAENVSVEDFGTILMDCCITHGNSLREIAESSGYRIWDPKRR